MDEQRIRELTALEAERFAERTPAWKGIRSGRRAGRSLLRP